ncbi:transcription termination/antitermination NusG family protein [uncultured Agrobacterium sp.]|uniref:transcription termination/antitermination protein NusG n=1 Tax=uncultured Agrobacterium sp. TaxID=157277 RepID=UPI0025890BFC|nr:transcription termination/antitermination NusG family protein [uncultured Agrobacterium sp.]
MMQHKFEDISRYVSMQGMVKLDKIAAEAAQVAREREAASKLVAESRADSAWIIVQVAYGREQAVEKEMAEAGISACVIMRMGPERKRRYRLIPPTAIPVFNGILFAFCSPTPEALRGVKSFEHVKGVVMAGEIAALVSSETIKQFREMAAVGEYDYKRGAKALKKGDKVRITSGPFVGFEVSVDAFADAKGGDAVVTIMIFGKPTVFNMPLVMLEKV